MLNQYQDDFKYLSDYTVLRAVLRNNEGGKQIENVQYIKDKYKNNQHMIDLIKLSQGLKVHNLCYIINRLKANFKSFFTKVKNGDKTAKPPKPKKLKLVNKYSILVDKIAVSYKIKDKIGINLNNKMFYIDFQHKNLPKNIQSLSIVYSNGEIYLHISHKPNELEYNESSFKEAGIDVGVINLLSIFVNDMKTKSIIIDGQMYREYNTKFNRIISKLNTAISKEVQVWKVVNGKSYPDKYSKRGNGLRKYKSKLFEKRNRFFNDQFHKISKRVIEYLIVSKVDKLVISYSLSSLKYNGNCKLNTKTKQSFIQIPFIKLLRYIEYKCNENGIKVNVINESYTSKTSCISDDVNHPKDKELNGVRSKRGLFKDHLINQVFNADLNGAVNHIKKCYKNFDFSWLEHFMFKLNNPIKIKCDYDFNVLLKTMDSGYRLLRRNESSESKLRHFMYRNVQV